MSLPSLVPGPVFDCLPLLPHTPLLLLQAKVADRNKALEELVQVRAVFSFVFCLSLHRQWCAVPRRRPPLRRRAERARRHVLRCANMLTVPGCCVQEATTRPLAGGPAEIKRINLSEAGGC